MIMIMESRPIAASTVSMAQVVLPSMANVAGNMHGGEVMKMMDGAAGVVAARHSHSNVVTASVTQLSFTEPIFVGDLVICNATLVYTGRTSMEVYVCVQAEDLERGGPVKQVSDGYFFMVALDRNGRPTEVPPLLIENEKQRLSFEAAKERLARTKQAKGQSNQ